MTFKGKLSLVTTTITGRKRLTFSREERSPYAKDPDNILHGNESLDPFRGITWERNQPGLLSSEDTEETELKTSHLKWKPIPIEITKQKNISNIFIKRKKTAGNWRWGSMVKYQTTSFSLSNEQNLYQYLWLVVKYCIEGFLVQRCVCLTLKM